MTDVSYDRRGSGSPLVLVHGLGSRWQVFEPILELLAEHGEVIAVDLPGFGQTPPDPGVHPSPQGYAEWLADLLELLGVGAPHVVGSSMGGGIALELGRSGVASRVTAFSPIGFWGTTGRVWTQTLLTGLRAVSTYAGPVVDRVTEHRVTRAAAVAPLFGRPGNIGRDEARDHIAGLVGAASFTAARDSFATYTFEPGQDLVKLADVPVTIAWGTRDVTLVHRTQSRKARLFLPFARHIDLPGCGHLPFSDDPALCARVILEEQP